MKHYLNCDEFKEFILTDRESDAEFSLCVENQFGDVDMVHFRNVHFCFKLILYSLPFEPDIGILQWQIDGGWENEIRWLWEDITEMFLMKPFIETDEICDKNLFN